MASIGHVQKEEPLRFSDHAVQGAFTPVTSFHPAWQVSPPLYRRQAAWNSGRPRSLSQVTQICKRLSQEGPRPS